MFQSGLASPPLYSVQLKKKANKEEKPHPKTEQKIRCLSNVEKKGKRQMMSKNIRRVKTPHCPKKCYRV